MMRLDINLKIANLIRQRHGETKCEDERVFLEQLATILDVQL